jgi:hypothetical protein
MSSLFPCCPKPFEKEDRGNCRLNLFIRFAEQQPDGERLTGRDGQAVEPQLGEVCGHTHGRQGTGRCVVVNCT